MKKIVMLTCLKANRVCTGAACLQAFNSKTKTFARYQEPLELEAFFRCNGCDAQGIGVWDEGMEEKVERLLSLHPDVVHLGVCTKEKRPTLSADSACGRCFVRSWCSHCRRNPLNR